MSAPPATHGINTEPPKPHDPPPSHRRLNLVAGLRGGGLHRRPSGFDPPPSTTERVRTRHDHRVDPVHCTYCIGLRRNLLPDHYDDDSTYRVGSASSANSRYHHHQHVVRAIVLPPVYVRTVFVSKIPSTPVHPTTQRASGFVSLVSPCRPSEKPRSGPAFQRCGRSEGPHPHSTSTSAFHLFLCPKCTYRSGTTPK